MEINAEFDRRVVLHSAQIPWQPSPMTGVDRRPLDRIGNEVARATSIVRYAPNSAFSPHTHDGGEEFIVLEGVFQDEHGDFPAGTYVRNPPTSRHTPRSGEGCVIFVKLWQFHPDDREPVKVTMDVEAARPDPSRPGVASLPLFRNDEETVRFEVWSPGCSGAFVADGGLELLVLKGSLREGDDELTAGSWLRVPDGARLTAVAGATGAEVWVKLGHLRHVRLPPPA